MIFDTHRTIGLVTGDKKFHMHRLDRSYLISVGLGSSYLTYTADSLKIKFLGPQVKSEIKAVSSYKDLVLLASGKTISGWHKIKQVKLYKGSSSTVQEILVLGDYVIGLNSTQELLVWFAESSDLHRVITLNYQPSCLMHPNTYLNKIIIALDRLTLLNVKTGKTIYEYPNIQKLISSDISAIEQSPILDVVALGLKEGKILIVNTSADSVHSVLSQDSKVISLSFSSFSGLEKLVSCDDSGYIYLWDLKTKVLDNKINAHAPHKVDCVQFIPNQPLFISSSGKGNAIKQYVFDSNDVEPRLLKQRSGFSTPPYSIKFYNNTHVLACSEDSLRDLSLINEHQSTHFSYKKLPKTMFHLKSFKSFDFAVTRERDWPNIVSCHSNTAALWSYEHKRIGDKPVERTNSSEPTCVSASQCGNFAVVGYKDGKIEKFNMQSGLNYLKFVGHSEFVVSICIDALNQSMISASGDGAVIFWDFLTGKQLRSVNTRSPILKMELDRNSSMLGISKENSLMVIDVRTYALVRQFPVDSPADLGFSHDSKWIAAAYSSYVKIWELASSRLIEWIEFSSDVTSLSFSSEFLATSHTNSLGVFLWANKAFYQNIIIEESPQKPVRLEGFDVKKVYYTREKVDIEHLFDDRNNENLVNIDKLPAPIDHESFALSSVAFYRTQALYNIDAVKERNKPVEPPKKPPKIPFFLDQLVAEQPETEVEQPKIKSDFYRESEGIFEKSCFEFLEFVKDCAPGKIELLMLELSDEQVLKCLEFLAKLIQSKKEYDFVQSLLSCFLKIHSDKLTNEQTAMLRQIQRNNWTVLEENFICAVSGLERLH